MAKLDHYGIQGQTHRWIQAFLSGRQQRVVIEGEAAEYVDVLSGVPQGTVLGPVLFLLFINDLPDGLQSPVRLFADDCVLYRQISTPADAITLQRDLDMLGQWEQKWQMDFNPSKCHVLHVTRSHSPSNDTYILRGHTLDAVEEATYLGVLLTSKINWTPHINNITAKASRTLGFVRRNLKHAPPHVKEQAYKTLVRPQLEYGCSVWAPHTQSDIYKVERVQRRAARFTTNRYRNMSSVGDMLNNLGWESLEQRRTKIRATLTYKIKNELVAIPKAPYLRTPPRRSRRLHAQSVHIQHNRTDYLKYSFFYRAPVIWNSLRSTVTEAPSLESFKAQLAKVTVTLNTY